MSARARRLSVRRGLPGRARRRIERLLRLVRDPPPYRCVYIRESHEMRDARRLVEAGLIVAVVSKWGWIGRRELTLYASHAEACGRAKWPRSALLPGGCRHRQR